MVLIPRTSQIDPAILKELQRPGILQQAGGAVLGGLSTVGKVLDTPGSVVRGVLHGDLDRAIGGIFDTSKRVYGSELLGIADNDKFTWRGLGAEILTDPLTFVTGGLTKAGTLARRADKLRLMKQAGTAQGGMLGMRQAQQTAGKLDELTRQYGDLGTLAGTKVEQAQQGQRAFLQLGIPFTSAQVDLLHAPGAYKALAPLGGALEAVGKPIGQALGRAFSTTYGLSPLEKELKRIDDMYPRFAEAASAQVHHRYLTQTKELSKNLQLPLKEVNTRVGRAVELIGFEDKFKSIIGPPTAERAVLASRVEKELMELPEGIRRLAEEVAEQNKQLLAEGQALGLTGVEDYGGIFGYLHRRLTPEGYKHLRESKDARKLYTKMMGRYQMPALRGFQKERHSRDIPIDELNKEFRSKLGIDFELFSEDVALNMAARVRDQILAEGNMRTGMSRGESFGFTGKGGKPIASLIRPVGSRQPRMIKYDTGKEKISVIRDEYNTRIYRNAQGEEIARVTPEQAKRVAGVLKEIRRAATESPTGVDALDGHVLYKMFGDVPKNIIYHGTNTEVVDAMVKSGGFRGATPSPGFSSSWMIDEAQDVYQAVKSKVNQSRIFEEHGINIYHPLDQLLQDSKFMQQLIHRPLNKIQSELATKLRAMIPKNVQDYNTAVKDIDKLVNELTPEIQKLRNAPAAFFASKSEASLSYASDAVKRRYRGQTEWGGVPITSRAGDKAQREYIEPIKTDRKTGKKTDKTHFTKLQAKIIAVTKNNLRHARQDAMLKEEIVFYDIIKHLEDRDLLRFAQQSELADLSPTASSLRAEVQANFEATLRSIFDDKIAPKMVAYAKKKGLVEQEAVERVNDFYHSIIEMDLGIVLMDMMGEWAKQATRSMPQPTVLSSKLSELLAGGYAQGVTWRQLDPKNISPELGIGRWRPDNPVTRVGPSENIIMKHEIPSEFFIKEDGTRLAPLQVEKFRAEEQKIEKLIAEWGPTASRSQITKALKDVGFPTKLPEDVYDNTVRIMQITQDPKELKPFLDVVDTVNAVYRGFLTGYFPAYHVRNWVSNIFLNMLGGVVNPRHYITAFNRLRKMSDEEKLYLKSLGVLGKGQHIESLRMIAESPLGRPGIVNKTFLPARKFGTMVDDHTRLAHYIAKKEQGFTDAEAAESVIKYLFDYDDLTGFEKKVMRRSIMFYTFTRKNLPLMIEAMFQNPKFMLNYSRAVGQTNPNIIEPAWLPDSFFLGENEKGEQLRIGLGLPPEDLRRFRSDGRGFARFLQLVLSNTTPLITAPYEMISGQSLFTGRDMGGSTLKRMAEISPISRFAGTFQRGTDDPMKEALRFGTSLNVRAIPEDQEQRNQLQEAENALQRLVRQGRARNFNITAQIQGQEDPEVAALNQLVGQMRANLRK